MLEEVDIEKRRKGFTESPCHAHNVLGERGFTTSN